MKRIALTVTSLLAGVTLAACGGTSTGTSTSHGSMSMPPASTGAAVHNQADVTFAQMMIPHHQQAIQMADLATTRASNPQVKALATKIRGAQAPEISTMTGWLTSWGQPTSMPGMTQMPGMDMGSMGSMPGMMSDADMTRLAGLSGAQFDREFLTMMIGHHTGAIEMARTEQAQGSYEPAKQLATSIIADQTAEIGQMRTLQSAKL